MSAETYRVCLYFIRHAQSEGNAVPNIIRGRDVSSQLTPLGFEQATLLGKRFKFQNVKFNYMLCSSAVRTIQTAHTVLAVLNLNKSKLIVTPELLEQSQGQWEGLDRKSPHIQEAIEKMKRQNAVFCAPEGESLDMVQKRAIAALEPYVEQAKQESIVKNRKITIVIFAHGGVIQSLLQYYLQSNMRDAWLIRQHNTAINEIILNENGVSLVKVNDYGHLTFLISEEALQRDDNDKQNNRISKD
ncbi:unnamed protein product [Rotaria socialis]|uniref:Phosphoglycerate mutase n=1 Tax=Rotaria socialis TaxID=392032 RepID=A0A820HUB9_9BILA|nr:unnamed protein product [Rotaria socialis]CAF3415371.1 unnamed protein product [Rotaria socialis]CAF3415904.1 unnamed protein product [Rotaria socialis]CAF4166559.1 unnamed protein product [Rotaria socialis]CAF4298663.1 unnamed protein product [Rotaria socialis]